MAKSVTVIPQTLNTYQPTAPIIRRKVAGYARVSTDSDEQFTSYEAQVDYYTQFILSHPEWEFVKVYTDEGITGTSTKHREGFNTMVADALDGKIDLIVTKSVSRFARNTVDSLTTIRKLKENGTEVFFEKEGIYTFDSKGELLLTIMSSLAQEESRSISENVTWGHRRRMADGRVTLPFKTFLGYDKGPDGSIVINREQAKVVRLIYRKFMDGLTPCSICTYLEKKGIPSPSGKSRWHKTTVESILTNEKYKGDALLQKTFTVDFLTKKKKANEGEVPQYYVSGNHEAIIPPAEFDQVQAEIARRKQAGQSYSGGYIYSSKIVCGDCGGFYGQKIWHSTGKNRKNVLRCNRKYDNHCTTPTLTEAQLQAMFVEAVTPLYNDAGVREDCQALVAMLQDTSRYDARIERLEAEMSRIAVENRKLIQAEAQGDIEGAGARALTALYDRYAAAQAKHDKLREERASRLQRCAEIQRFADGLDAMPGAVWDEQAWNLLVKQVTVQKDGTVEFEFRNDSMVTVQIPA